MLKSTVLYLIIIEFPQVQGFQTSGFLPFRLFVVFAFFYLCFYLVSFVMIFLYIYSTVDLLKNCPHGMS